MLANEDASGLGYHGDFLTGWDQQLLQSAINECTNLTGRVEDCPLFTIQTETVASMCHFQQPLSLSSEDYQGPEYRLPIVDNVSQSQLKLLPGEKQAL